MERFWEMMTVLVGGVVTVALISVIVSQKSTSPALVQNWFSGFGNVLGAAEQPVTGAANAYNYSYAATGYRGGLA